MKMFRKDEGFTLIELMVVVLIIGILVAIAIPVFNAAQANAKAKTCQANQRTVNGAANTYRADSGNYPAALTDLTTAGNQYLKSVPTCPGTGASGTGGAYTYDATSGTIVGDGAGAAAFYDGHALP